MTKTISNAAAIFCALWISNRGLRVVIKFFNLSRDLAGGSFALKIYPKERDASAEKCSSAKSCASSFGYAAAAIIAALSVESPREGKKTGIPPDSEYFMNSDRRRLLDATPPLTIKDSTSRSSAA